MLVKGVLFNHLYVIIDSNKIIIFIMYSSYKITTISLVLLIFKLENTTEKERDRNIYIRVNYPVVATD